MWIKLPVCSGPTASVNRYHTQSGERSTLPSLPEPVYYHACAVFNNTIIVSGGVTFISGINQVWELDLQADKWKPLPSLQNKRYSSFSSWKPSLSRFVWRYIFNTYFYSIFHVICIVYTYILRHVMHISLAQPYSNCFQFNYLCIFCVNISTIFYMLESIFSNEFTL